MYEIENGIEIPKSNYGYYSKYPFGEMEIGESFFVPFGDDKHIIRVRVQTAASYYGKRNNVRFLTRTVDGGVRVWRVE